MQKTIEVRKMDLLGVLFLLLVLGAWLWDRHNLSTELAQTVANSNAKDVISSRWKDAYQREHVSGQVREYTIKQIKASTDSAIVELRKEVGNIKNLVARTTITSTTSGTVATVTKDTVWIGSTGKKVEAKKFSYTDHWLRLNGLVTDDSTKVNYAVDNTTVNTWKWERQGAKWKIWKPKDLVFDIRSDNPNTTIGSVQTIRVSSPKKKFFETQWFSGIVGVGLGILATHR